MALGYRTARLSLGGGEVLPFGCHKFSKWNPFYFSLLIHGFSATQKALLIALPFTPLDPSVNCWFCYRAFQSSKAKNLAFCPFPLWTLRILLHFL